MSQNAQMDERILDRLAACCAEEIVAGAIALPQKAKDVDILVTKALGVLQENGVYACFLFLLSRTQDKEKEISAVVRDKLLDMIGQDLNFAGWQEQLPSQQGRDAEAVLTYVANTVCAHLDPLLMTKELLEQTLIYARYGAKARKNEGN